MTEPQSQAGEGGRVDLRAIDVDGAQTDRVVGAVLARIRGTTPQPRDELLELARRSTRPAAIVATLLAAAAVLAIAFVDRRDSAEPQPEAVLASWAESQHVPTNGELLAAFHGYGR